MLASLVLDVGDETMVVSEMVAVSVFLAAIDLFWWWTLVFRREPGDRGGVSGPLIEFKLLQSLSLVGVIAGFWLFGPLTDGYPEGMAIWVAMVLGPVAILLVRLLMGFAGWGDGERARKGNGA